MRTPMQSRAAAGLALLAAPLPLLAADAAASPLLGMLKTLFGLLVVLAVMAAVAWAFKRYTPARLGTQSALRIVGGVSVGAREKVVVLEVADRWLVVGVAPGQVSSIANLDIVRGEPAADAAGQEQATPQADAGKAAQAFAGWLKKSLEKR